MAKDGPLTKFFARVRGTRRHGWLRNPRDQRDHSTEAKYGFFDAGVVLPANFTLRDAAESSPDLPADQVSTQSCVGQGYRGIVIVAERARGIVVEPPSALDAYYNARMNAPLSPAKVTDDGCYPRSLADAAMRRGVCHEGMWPFDPAKVNKSPSWEARRDAYARAGGSYSFIQSEGDALERAVQATLVTQRLPVGFGTQIGESYEDNNGPEIVDFPYHEPTVGDHYQVIVGYETTQNGVLYEVLNSWNKIWRDGGFVKFTGNYVRANVSSDFLVLDGWNSLK